MKCSSCGKDCQGYLPPGLELTKENIVSDCCGAKVIRPKAPAWMNLLDQGLKRAERVLRRD